MHTCLGAWDVSPFLPPVGRLLVTSCHLPCILMDTICLDATASGSATCLFILGGDAWATGLWEDWVLGYTILGVHFGGPHCCSGPWWCLGGWVGACLHCTCWAACHRATCRCPPPACTGFCLQNTATCLRPAPPLAMPACGPSPAVCCLPAAAICP